MADGLKDKVAFITGAAHGQGRATALALAKEGVHIVAFDIAQTLSYPGYALGSANDLDTLKDECAALGVKALAFAGDVRVDDDIVKAVNGPKKHLGILIYCLIMQAFALTAAPMNLPKPNGMPCLT